MNVKRFRSTQDWEEYPGGTFVHASDFDSYKARAEALLRQAREALGAVKRTHLECEDPWYSCPKSPEGCSRDSAGNECDCGADRANAKIDAALSIIDAFLADKEG